MFRKNKVLLMVILSVLFLSACGKDKESSSETASKFQSVNTFLVSEPKTLDPSMATDTYSTDILINIFEGLTRMSKDSSGEDVLEGAGALSWETSEDETVWTFKLRDHKWTDGIKVTAHDYVYGIGRSLDSATASPYAYLLFPIKNSREVNRGDLPLEDLGVRAVDDATLEITLEKRTPYFMELTYSALMFPERRDIVEKSGDLYGSTAEHIVSNGPFSLDLWEHEQKVSLKKNEGYWDKDSVNIDQINFYITRDENVRMSMLFKGEAQIGEASKKEWADKFLASGDFYEYPGYSAATNYLFFNGNEGIFKNKNIRKAFSLGIKRDEMADTVYRGLFDPAYALVSPGIHINGRDFRGVAGTKKPEDKTTGEAREYLIKGLQELGIDKTPEEINITYLNPSTSTWARTYSEYLAAMYKETLGVNITSEFLSWPLFEERVKNRDYDMGGMAWYADYNDPSSFLELFISESDVSPVSWDNSDYDDLLGTASHTDDPKERLKAFMAAEDLLLDEGWIAPTVYIKRRLFLADNIKGYSLTPFTSADFKNIYIEKNN